MQVVVNPFIWSRMQRAGQAVPFMFQQAASTAAAPPAPLPAAAVAVASNPQSRIAATAVPGIVAELVAAVVGPEVRRCRRDHSVESKAFCSYLSSTLCCRPRSSRINRSQLRAMRGGVCLDRDHASVSKFSACDNVGFMQRLIGLTALGSALFLQVIGCKHVSSAAMTPATSDHPEAAASLSARWVVSLT